MAEPNALRILVVNGKGGCGKTTIATNLAAAYARLGYCVALTDHDSQASSTQWLEQRAAPLPEIHLVAAHERTAMYTTRAYAQRLPHGVERIIIDTPSAVSDRDLDSLLRGIDAILVPLLPSSIDIRAGARFITQLLSHRSYRARPAPIGVIANRVRHNTTTHTKLMQFLDCLDVPTIATFRDSALYTRLADEGSGIFDDVSDSSAEREALEWSKLMHWIDEVTSHRTGTRQLGPLAAAPHQRNSESASAEV
jgi:chromosome partitioning protein